jgi:hypothetical protein
MCRLSSRQYRLYRRTNAAPKRSLFVWLRELWLRRRPKPAEAEVVPFPTAASKRADQAADRGGPKAA